jgi:hypothetical protein
MNEPSIELSFSPSGPQFFISEDAVMPVITVTATPANFAPDPKAGPPIYSWTASLNFRSTSAPNAGPKSDTSHPAIAPKTGPSNSFTIPFTAVRGGDLVVSVTVQFGARQLGTSSKGLVVLGKNPPVNLLAATAPGNIAFRKLMQLESSLRQFLPSGYPLFSQDQLGGVGLCQVTYPPPTADEIWNWKANIEAGWQIYQEKETAARRYPERVRNSPGFSALVRQYQRDSTSAPCYLVEDQLTIWRHPILDAVPPPFAHAGSARWIEGFGYVNSNQPDLDVWPNNLTDSFATMSFPSVTVRLPDYTEEQLRRDTIRGYNGYSGADPYGIQHSGLHEYRVKVDRYGKLVATRNSTGSVATAEWERVTPDQRPVKSRGQDYVDLVEGKTGF